MPYHVNYCTKCRALYFNHRFKAAQALEFMIHLGVGADDTPWEIVFRFRGGPDVLNVVWA